MKWLDHQPESSVVFLCFGSMGSLSGAQVREIAIGLERTGHRFLWSLREPPKGKLDLLGDYTNPDEVLPDGFIERTTGIGLVSGWVPQVTILAHKAIGGFVSHCGWNSILESLWYGVPIATWPVYAEQQINAFEMVVEFKLTVEIRLDYRLGSDLVVAEEVERGVRGLMDGGWVPQVTILAHKAIGGFVSHCGWNSILESLWYGVPIATWPVYAEQQINAFEMVVELKLTVEIRLDYRLGSDLVVAEEVERGVRGLMDGADEVREKVKEMSEKSKMAMMENGSSDVSLGLLIEKLMAQI